MIVSSTISRPFLLLGTYSNHYNVRNAYLAQTTALLLSNKNDNVVVSTSELSFRARSVVYMGSAMMLHFGGYEFMRNSCLSLLTSDTLGSILSHAAVFPLLNGLISPFGIVMLVAYSRILEKSGPRTALRQSSWCSVAFILTTVTILYASQQYQWHAVVSQLVIGLAFLFQNTYQHLLYTQHWSFVSSIVSPQEGNKWFSVLNGCISLFCSLVGSSIHFIVPQTGLLGLMMLAAVFLSASLVCGDRAYQLAEQHGFDPDEHNKMQTSSTGDDNNKNHPNKEENRVTKTVKLFRRTPTLQALLMEAISYQCLSTILNVAFVRSLKETITNDIARSAFTGRFYSLINAMSTAIQFFLMPFILKRAEQSTLWRVTPILPLLFCVLQVVLQSHQLSLTVLAAAFFITKLTDYAFRSVTYILVYQPLDFEGRYLGKETIGLFGGRLGKSGMSLLLSGMTVLGLANMSNLTQMALAFSGVWTWSCHWLARLVPSRTETQRIVEERNERQEKKQR